MFGGFIIGFVCDMPWLSRPMRAKLAWLLLFLVGNGVMGGGLAFEDLREANPKNWIDFHSSAYAGPVGRLILDLEANADFDRPSFTSSTACWTPCGKE